MADGASIADACDEVCYGIGYHIIIDVELPGRLLDARDVSLERLLAEADAAKIEIAHETAWAAALEAATNHARSELRRAVCLDDHRFLCHVVYFAKRSC
jgi:hypothetical protein